MPAVLLARSGTSLIRIARDVSDAVPEGLGPQAAGVRRASLARSCDATPGPAPSPRPALAHGAHFS